MDAKNTNTSIKILEYFPSTVRGVLTGIIKDSCDVSELVNSCSYKAGIEPNRYGYTNNNHQDAWCEGLESFIENTDKAERIQLFKGAKNYYRLTNKERALLKKTITIMEGI